MKEIKFKEFQQKKIVEKSYIVQNVITKYYFSDYDETQSLSDCRKYNNYEEALKELSNRYCTQDYEPIVGTYEIKEYYFLTHKYEQNY
jgi:hypothetical protein